MFSLSFFVFVCWSDGTAASYTSVTLWQPRPGSTLPHRGLQIGSFVSGLTLGWLLNKDFFKFPSTCVCDTHTHTHRGDKSWYCVMILQGDLFSSFVMVIAGILVTFFCYKLVVSIRLHYSVNESMLISTGWLVLSLAHWCAWSACR